MDINRNVEREKFPSRILNSQNDKPIGDFKERFAHPFMNLAHGCKSPPTLGNTEIDMHDRQLHEKSFSLTDRLPSFMGTGQDYTHEIDEDSSVSDIRENPLKSLDSLALLQDRPKPLEIFNRTKEGKPTTSSSVGEKDAELNEVTMTCRDADSTASLHGQESGFTLTPTDSHGSFEVIEEGVSDVEQEKQLKETLLPISSSGAVMDEFRTTEEDRGRISKSLSTLSPSMAQQQPDGDSEHNDNVEAANEPTASKSKTYSTQDPVSRMAVDLERLRSDDQLTLDTESIFGPTGVYPLTGHSTVQTARSRLDSESELDFSWLNPNEPTSDIANILTALDDLRYGVHSLSRNDFTQNEPYPTGQAIHPRMSYIVNAVVDNDMMQSHGLLRPVDNIAEDVSDAAGLPYHDNDRDKLRMGYSPTGRGQQHYSMWNMDTDDVYLTDTAHLTHIDSKSWFREPELSEAPPSLPLYGKGGTLPEIYSGIVNDLDEFERNLRRLEHNSHAAVDYFQPNLRFNLKDQRVLNHGDLLHYNATPLENDEERQPGDIMLSTDVQATSKASYTVTNPATYPLGLHEEPVAVDYDTADAFILTEEANTESKPINFYISSHQTSRASTPTGETDADKWEAGSLTDQEGDSRSDGSDAHSATERSRDKTIFLGGCGDIETVCEEKIQLIVTPRDLSVPPEKVVFDEEMSARQGTLSRQHEMDTVSADDKEKNTVMLTSGRNYGQEDFSIVEQGDNHDATALLDVNQAEFADHTDSAGLAREFLYPVDDSSELEVEEINRSGDDVSERRVYFFSQSVTITIDPVQLDKPPSTILQFSTDVIIPQELQADIDVDSEPLIVEKPPEFEEKPTSVDDLCTPVLAPHPFNKTWKSELNDKTAYSLQHHFSDELLQEQDHIAGHSPASSASTNFRVSEGHEQSETSDGDLTANGVREEVFVSPFCAEEDVTLVSDKSSLSREDSQSDSKAPVDLEKYNSTEPESKFGMVINKEPHHYTAETVATEVSNPADQAAVAASDHGGTRKGSSVFELVSDSSSEDSENESVTESGEYFTSREPYYIVEEAPSFVEEASGAPPTLKKSEAMQDVQALEESSSQRNVWKLADHVSPGELAETTDTEDLSLNCPDILQHALHKIFEQERMADIRSAHISQEFGGGMHHFAPVAADLTIEEMLEESNLKTSVFDLVPGQSEPVVHDPHLPSSAVHRILKPSGQRSWYQLADLPVTTTHLSDQNLKRTADIQAGVSTHPPTTADEKHLIKSLSTHSSGFGPQNQEHPTDSVTVENVLRRRVIAGVTSHGDAVIPEPRTSESGEPTPEYLKRFDQLVGYKKDWMYDKTMIEPYAHLVDIRINEDGANEPTAVFLYPCLLPDHADPDYEKLMENLLMYVLSNVQKIEHAPYRIVFFNSGIPHGCEPSAFWLQRVYKSMDETMKQNLIDLLIVHPHFKIKAQLQTAGRAILSKDFFRKIKFVQGLKELGRMLSIQYAAIPKPVRDYDRKKEWKLSKACC